MVQAKEAYANILKDKLVLMNKALEEDSKAKLALTESVKDILYSVGKLKQSLDEVLSQKMVEVKNILSNTSSIMEKLVVNK
jgi:predicted RNA-binding protein with PUA domain